MELIVVDDADAVGNAAADSISSRMAGRRSFALGVATGGSPVATYESLAAHHRALTDRVDLEVFALDEYIGLPAGSPHTYRETLMHTVARPLGLAAGAVHTPDAWAGDVERAAGDYERLVVDAGIDLQILGIGANGHIGFNEPYTGLASRTHVGDLSQETRRDNSRFFASLADVPSRCITQGIGTILDAGALLLVAHGAAKADAIAAALLGPVTWACPASAVQLHPDVVVVIDRDAAAALDRADLPYRQLADTAFMQRSN